MEVIVHQVAACCGKTGVILKIVGESLTTNFATKLLSFGFTENQAFRNAGILYLTSTALSMIITGPLGSNRLNIKMISSTANVDENLNKLKEILKQI